MEILIVEDDFGTKYLLEEVAKSLGHEVTSCASAEEALQLFIKTPFPLILLDWGLPKMDGLELCRNIRTLPDGDKSVTIMITGRENPDNLKKILDAGIDDYIPKSWIRKGLVEIRLKVAEGKVHDRVRRKQAESNLKELVVKTEKKYDDICSILNKLKIGAAIIRKDGLVEFLNLGAEVMLGVTLDKASGIHWADILPLDQSGINQVRKRWKEDSMEQEKLSFHFWNIKGKEYWVEFDLKEDPRNSENKIFLFYDVSELRNLKDQLHGHHRFHELIGKSDCMMELRQQILNLSKLDWTVMIEGETGAGKELVARAIHFSSNRKDKPFIAVNAAGLNDSLLSSQLFGHKRGAFTGAHEDQVGLFESACGGTLFLDEIGDISPNLQISLLRVLEDQTITRLGESKAKKVDVRFVTATNRILQEEVLKGNFREDLLYRLRVARVHVPPLRERFEDLPLLTEHFLSSARAATGKMVHHVSVDAMQMLMKYQWPGNVRELKSAINYSIIHCKGSMIDVEDLPAEVVGFQDNEKQFEFPIDSLKMDLEKAIKAAGGNRAKAARLMGISRATLYRRLAKNSQ